MNTPVRAETGKRDAAAARPRQGPRPARDGGGGDGALFLALWLLGFLGVVLILHTIVILAPKDARDLRGMPPPWSTEHNLDRSITLSPGTHR